jgi:hypothetical protein
VTGLLKRGEGLPQQSFGFLELALGFCNPSQTDQRIAYDAPVA